jgi:hypothetical protein
MALRLKDFGLPMGYKHKMQKLTAEYKETFLAEKGGSRTLRGPYDPQTGFEDQRHHRAPSFSRSVFSCLPLANRSSVTIPVAICEVSKAAATTHLSSPSHPFMTVRFRFLSSSASFWSFIVLAHHPAQNFLDRG